MRKIGLCLSVLLVLAGLLATHPAFGNDTLFYQTYAIQYSTLDGLPSNEVYAVCQDREGFIWMSTDRGLVQYDGYDFKVFTLNDGINDMVAFKMFEDVHQNLWLATYNRKLYYRTKNGEFKAYRYNDLITTVNIPAGFTIQNLYIDSLQNAYLVFHDCYFVHIDSEGCVYVDGHYSKDKSYQWLHSIHGDDHSMSYFSNTEFFPSPIAHRTRTFPANTVDAIVSVNFDFKYIFTGDSILLQTRDKRFFFHADHLPVISEKTLLIRKVGHQFILNQRKRGYGRGSVEMHSSLTSYSSPKRLLSNIRMTDAILDREGGVWITTLYSGVFYIPNLHHRILSENDEFNIILPIKGELWMGKDQQYNFFKSLGDMGWVDANKHSFGWDELGHSNVHFHLPMTKGFFLDTTSNVPTKIYGFHHWAPRNVMVWTMARISSMLSSQKEVGFPVSPNEEVVIALFRHEKTIWIGTLNGLYVLRDSVLSKYTYREGNINDRIQDIFYLEKEKVLLIGTLGNGLFLLRADTLVNHLENHDGLPSNTINQIYMEKEKIWIATNSGLGYIETSSIDHKNPKVHRPFSHLTSPHVLQVFSRDSLLYVGTDHGLNVFNPNQYSKNQDIDFPLGITSVKVNETTFPANAFYDKKLAHSSNNISIFYRGLSFNKGRGTIYRYRLTGLQEKWTTTKMTSVQFVSLPDGHYAFELEAQKSDGHWIPCTNMVQFDILKPYWQTLWFRLGVLVLTISLISGLFLYNIQNLKNQNKIEREAMSAQQRAMSAQLNPHFIFNALSRLQNLILKNERNRANDYLGNFSKLLRSTFEYSKKSLIPIHQEVSTLQNYIELEALRHQGRIHFHLEMSEDQALQQALIPPLLLQPIIENAIWHGLLTGDKQGQLKISIYALEDEVHIEIEDNGIGREAAGKIKKNVVVKEQKSSGIAITRERLRLIEKSTKRKTRFIFEDLKGVKGNAMGSRIHIVLPRITDTP